MTDATPASGPAAPAAKSHVLVVEDERTASHALEVLLRHYGYTVAVAATVAEAVPLVRGEPDFILLDLMLPDGDGTGLLQLVRDERLRSRVAVVTGSNDPDRLDRVRRLGPDVLLSKPVDFLEILKRLPPAG